MHSVRDEITPFPVHAELSHFCGSCSGDGISSSSSSSASISEGIRLSCDRVQAASYFGRAPANDDNSDTETIVPDSELMDFDSLGTSAVEEHESMFAQLANLALQSMKTPELDVVPDAYNRPPRSTEEERADSNPYFKGALASYTNGNVTMSSSRSSSPASEGPYTPPMASSEFADLLDLPFHLSPPQRPEPKKERLPLRIEIPTLLHPSDLLATATARVLRRKPKPNTLDFWTEEERDIVADEPTFNLSLSAVTRKNRARGFAF